MLELPGYFETKPNLLYCNLEMHFKYILQEDSYIPDAEGKAILFPDHCERGFLSVCSSPYYCLSSYFKAKTLLFAACYLIYRELILCNVLYIYTSK